MFGLSSFPIYLLIDPTLTYNIKMEYLNKSLAEDEVDTKEPQILERTKCSLKTSYEKQNLYVLPTKSRDYSRQFFAMYQQRLTMLKPRVDREATRKWGENTRQVNGKTIQHKEKILDIVSGELCWVSGTIFLDMKHKLNILKDVERGTDDSLPKHPEKYVDQDNEAVIMIEDESGRAILHNEELLRRLHLVTGCVVGVLGIEIQAGIFEIMEIVNPTPAPQLVTLDEVDKSENAPEEWLALCSGLQMGKETELDHRLILLQQWLSGELGGASERKFAQKISSLIILGNSVAENVQEENTDFTTTNNFGLKNTAKFSAESLTLYGQWLAEVLATIPAVVMPGDSDPCEICLPQQPIHRALFSKNAPFVGSANLTTLTNPAWIESGNGLRILATSGQNIDDICKYRTETKSSEEILEIMEQTLRWQNFIPTAPDTLYCYPFEDSDPFTLDETPNLYVVGNQCASGFKNVEIGSSSVKLISIPDFKTVGEIVLVNTSTLEHKVMRFE